MSRTCLAITAFTLVIIASSAPAADKDADKLQGVWDGVSIEVDGKVAPDEAAKRMRLTFKGENLIIKGNFRDDREETCTYKVDSTKSPKTLDFKTPTQRELVLCIYELNGDDLKICFVKGSPTHPKEMTSKKQAVITFKRGK